MRRGGKESGERKRQEKNTGEENLKRQLDLLLCDGLGRDSADDKETRTRGETRGGRMTAENTRETKDTNKRMNSGTTQCRGQCRETEIRWRYGSDFTTQALR